MVLSIELCTVQHNHNLNELIRRIFEIIIQTCLLKRYQECLLSCEHGNLQKKQLYT